MTFSKKVTRDTRVTRDIFQNRNVTGYFFGKCHRLLVRKLSRFTRRVTGYFFRQCHGLRKIGTGYLFENCHRLLGVSRVTFIENVTDYVKLARVTCSKIATGYKKMPRVTFFHFFPCKVRFVWAFFCLVQRYV